MEVEAVLDIEMVVLIVALMGMLLALLHYLARL